MDYSDLQNLEKKYKRMAQSKQGLTSRKIMKQAIKPTLDVMEKLVPQPTGGGGSAYLKKKQGDLHPYSTGALKKTLRTKVVRDSPYEIKGLVGAGKKVIGHYIKSKKALWNAGNRAHLSEFGPTGGKRFWKHKPFAKPAETQTKDLVERRLGTGVNASMQEEFRQEQ